MWNHPFNNCEWADWLSRWFLYHQDFLSIVQQRIDIFCACVTKFLFSCLRTLFGHLVPRWQCGSRGRWRAFEGTLLFSVSRNSTSLLWVALLVSSLVPVYQALNYCYSRWTNMPITPYLSAIQIQRECKCRSYKLCGSPFYTEKGTTQHFIQQYHKICTYNQDYLKVEGSGRGGGAAMNTSSLFFTPEGITATQYQNYDSRQPKDKGANQEEQTEEDKQWSVTN